MGDNRVCHLRPLCLCGCNRRVKRLDHQYFEPACVPAWIRREAGKTARRNYAYRRRALYFASVRARLTRTGRTLTTEALLEAFAEVYRHAYGLGYHACEDKHRQRSWKKANAA